MPWLTQTKTPRLTKKRFIAGSAATAAVTGEPCLGTRPCFHHHAPKQIVINLAFHQQAADELRCHHLSRAAKEELEEDREGLGGQGSDLGDRWRLLGQHRDMQKMHSQTSA